jgi:catechol 2,3-dioxygenase-like lactoylglutathione lyase family enzyme
MPLSASGVQSAGEGATATGFERIVIAVPELDEAVGEYRRLTGLEGVPGKLQGAVEVTWFGLGNTVIQLQRGDYPAATVSGLVLSPAGESPVTARVENDLSLDLRLSDGRDLSSAVIHTLPTGDLRVDHLVLRTGDPEACIALFTSRLGIRLALDKLAPQWGGRMLFFRAGRLTLEVISAEETTRTAFWGIAYQCADIEATVAQLQERGVSVTEIRDGRKPGTRVATVKSHCLGIPTLLLEPAT